MTTAVPAKRKRAKKSKDESGLLVVAVSRIQPRWIEAAMAWSKDKGYGIGRASAMRAVLRDWFERHTQGESK